MPHRGTKSHQRSGSRSYPGAGLAALRTLAADTLMLLHGHLEAQFAPGRAQSDIVIHEADKMLNPVQNRFNFQLHGWSLGFIYSIVFDTDRVKPKTSFFPVPTTGGISSLEGSVVLTRAKAIRAQTNFPRPQVTTPKAVTLFGRRRASGGDGFRAHKLASPPVATRNGLARRLPKSPVFTHKFCYRAEIRITR